MELEVGNVYGYGKLTRLITKIERNNIFYTRQNGKECVCWVTTFEDWVKKQDRENAK